MVDRTIPADERALRLELQELTKKRGMLTSSKRRGGTTPSGSVAGRRSVFDRLGREPTRARGTFRHVQLKENKSWGNATHRQGKRDHEDNRESTAFKRQKLHSAVTRPDGAHEREKTEANGTIPSPVSPSTSTARIQERKLRAVAPYAQKDSIARSRRMFGALMGHLGKAKRQIEKDTSFFKRQDAKQQEAEQKEKTQSQYLETQARREAEAARLDAVIARTLLDRREGLARAKLEHLQTVRKSASQSEFLLTISSPPIYYLPAKHTKETKELVAASMEAHDAKLRASVQTHEETVRKMEAEYGTKLETLQRQLETIQKEKTAATRVATNQGLMEEVSEANSKESDKDDKEGGDDMSDGSRRASKLVQEDAAMVPNTMSDRQANETVAKGKRDGEKTDPATILLDSSGRKVETQAENRARHDSEVLRPSREDEDKRAVNQNETKVESAQQCDEVAMDSNDAGYQAGADGKVANDNTETESSHVSTENSVAHVAKMKVFELRAELKKRGLDAKGLKAVLVLRLQQAIIDGT